MYSLFYNYRSFGDVLIINFNNNLESTDSKKSGNVVALFNDEKIIGYKILSISKFMKIHSEGLIFNPIPQMIDVINSILINAGFEKLDYVQSSGHIVTKIVDINSNELIVNDGKNNYKIKNIYQELSIGDYVVLIKNGYFTQEAKLIDEKEYDGLLLIENKEVVKINSLNVGEDYYKGEIQNGRIRNQIKRARKNISLNQ